MARQISKLDLILFKAQASLGTPQAALLAADLLECSGTYSLEPQITKMDLVSAGFNNTAPVIGPFEASFEPSIPWRSGNAVGDFGQIDRALKTCGFKAVVASNITTYTPTNKFSEFVDGTMWGYSGNTDTLGSHLAKLVNLLGAWKLELDFEKGTVFFMPTYKGSFLTAPIAATMPAITSRLASAMVSVKSCVLSILGNTKYLPIKMSFESGQEMDNGVDMTTASGRGIGCYGDRKITMSADVYQDTIANLDPVTALLAGTSGAFSLQFGSTAKKDKTTIASTAGFVLDESIKSSDRNGVKLHSIKASFIANDFSIALDTSGV